MIEPSGSSASGRADATTRSSSVLSRSGRVQPGLDLRVQGQQRGAALAIAGGFAPV